MNRLTNIEIEHINTAMKEVIQQRVDLSHFRDLFLIRTEKNINPEIKEIGDFINHNPKEWGDSYKLVERFCIDTVRLYKNGHNELHSNWQFVSQNLFVDYLTQSLRAQSVMAVDLVDNLKAYPFTIMKSVIQLLDGKSFNIKHPDIESCVLHAVENHNTIYSEIRINLVEYSEKTSMKVIDGMMQWTLSGPVCTSFLIAYNTFLSPGGYWRIDDGLIKKQNL